MQECVYASVLDTFLLERDFHSWYLDSSFLFQIIGYTRLAFEAQYTTFIKEPLIFRFSHSYVSLDRGLILLIRVLGMDLALMAVALIVVIVAIALKTVELELMIWGCSSIGRL